MGSLAGAVAFFDIGDTLASVAIDPGGDGLRLTEYGYVPAVLGHLRNEDVRLGIISDPGTIPQAKVNAALGAAGLLDHFEPDLIVYGRKNSGLIFGEASARAGVQPGRQPLLFVGEDPIERAHARSADFLVAPHPLLAGRVLRGATLRYARITVPDTPATTDWRAALRELDVIPLHTTGRERTTVYAIVTSDVACRLDDLGFWVDRLGDEGMPLTSDVYLLRDDRQLASGFLQPTGSSAELFETGPASRIVLSSTEEGLFVAVPAGRSVESLHFRNARHGHNLKLVPSVTLLDAFDDPSVARLATAPRARHELAPIALSVEEKKLLKAKVRKTQIQKDVERYSGARALDATRARIASRHVHHTGGVQAVDALVADLSAVGGGRLQVRRHRFTHEGRSLDNVEAELPASGLDGIVVVSAHLDSTASGEARFRPALDAAPGADDDGGGLAGVLAAAGAIEALDAALGVPRRAVRFVLFNAEEHGLAGSRAYARDRAALGDRIVGALQMDMIGFDFAGGRSFELHAGFRRSADVERRSVELARLVAELVPQVSSTLTPQIYPDDRGDPAESRSDHFSFQLEGYPACVASEDFFVGPGPDAPAPEPNPRYHMSGDTTVNAAYAADIARAVTAAAWVTATR